MNLIERSEVVASELHCELRVQNLECVYQKLRCVGIASENGP